MRQQNGNVEPCEFTCLLNHVQYSKWIIGFLIKHSPRRIVCEKNVKPLYENAEMDFNFTGQAVQMNS